LMIYCSTLCCSPFAQCSWWSTETNSRHL